MLRSHLPLQAHGHMLVVGQMLPVYVSVFVTPNTSYQLEIFSSCNYYGGTPDYSQAFSVTV